MTLYEQQLKDQEVNYKLAKKKKKHVKRSLDILTFDIEVTSAWKDPARGMIAYEPGHSADYWNSLEKYALCYIWQFSYNDTVYYGRELEGFKKALDDLPDDIEFIIWVHNLSYEMGFLINLFEVDQVFARTPHKPMYIVFKEHKNIIFKCSYILTNLSLDAWGKQLGVKKLTGNLDYNVMRTPNTPLTPEEMAYCERDCIVVYEGIRDHLKHYKDVWDIPNTSTGKIRRVVKKRVTNDYDYMRDIKRCIPADADELKLLQDIFAGGYTHSNRKYTSKVVQGPGEHVDFASSYPYSICAFRYPYNKWCYYGRQLPDSDTFEYRAYIIKLHFKGLKCISWNTYISSAKSRGHNMLYDNGRVLCADELWIAVTEQDYITICNNYTWESVESEGTWICHKRYLPTIFIDYVLQLYEDKTELKGVDPVRYAISKQYINSLFGMMVTSLFNAEVKFDINRSEQWYIEPLTQEYVNTGLEKMRRWFDKKYFLSYSVGCWITAYSRRRLWECIERMDSRVLYCDTDSLFYTGTYNWDKCNAGTDKRLKEACKYHDIDFERTRPRDPAGNSHPLGRLDFEPNFDRFKSLGAKKYIEERDGQLYMTVAGINKGAVACLDGDINNFRDGFVFDKDHPAVKKMEHTYLTDMKEVIYPDGFISDYKYGINLRPTGYQLSVPTVYDVLEVLYKNMTGTNENEIIRRRGIFT